MRRAENTSLAGGTIHRGTPGQRSAGMRSWFSAGGATGKRYCAVAPLSVSYWPVSAFRPYTAPRRALSTCKPEANHASRHAIIEPLHSDFA